jgi:hypothetical protein
MLKFTAPVTGDVWWQDGQIKEEEEEVCHTLTITIFKTLIALKFKSL